jgi:hypothetical protein
MLNLADIQLRFRDAVVEGDDSGIVPLLAGSSRAERLQVHRRHYETSLVNALIGKFPGTVWLTGTPFVTEAARHFVRKFPPHAPCIAEYGQNFPQFLSAGPDAHRIPYLPSFAELEWLVGRVSIAINRVAATPEAFYQIDGNALADMAVQLQPGVAYLDSPWPVDELMTVYLSGAAPDRMEFIHNNVCLEIRGCYGEFHIERIAQSDFSFRRALLEGKTVGDAAEETIKRHSTFEPGNAFAALISEGLVVAK